MDAAAPARTAAAVVSPVQRSLEQHRQREMEIAKTVELLNTFAISTVQFLNRFHAACDRRLHDISATLTRLETQTTLLEYKISSVDDDDDDDDDVDRSESHSDSQTRGERRSRRQSTSSDADEPQQERLLLNSRKSNRKSSATSMDNTRRGVRRRESKDSTAEQPPPTPAPSVPPRAVCLLVPPLLPVIGGLAGIAVPPPPPKPRVVRPRGGGKEGTGTAYTMCTHPRLHGYFELLLANVPVEEVRRRMLADKVDPQWLDTPHAAAPADLPDSAPNYEDESDEDE